MTDPRSRSQKEDLYLNILRRVIIATAQISLIMSVLLLLIGGGLYGYASFGLAQKYSLSEAKDALLKASDPARWLRESGLYSKAELRPKKYVMSSELQAETDQPEAYLKARQSVATPINRSYRDPSNVRSEFTPLVERMLQPVEAAEVWEKKDAFRREEARILLGNVLIEYSKSLGNIVRDHKASFDKPITGDGDSVRENIEKLFDWTFVVTAAQDVLKTSLADYNDVHSRAVSITAWATESLIGACSAFGYFLFIMFIFVIVKAEIDLREIRDALRQNAPNDSR